jgi:hypothetical protein
MPLQIPQLDDRNFAQLVAEVTARIPVHTPEWNNFNDSDPGMTLVQLFSFMTENLLYRSNRMPEANRLKFLSLLGIGLQPASAGRGLVEIRNERGPLRATTLRSGTELLAGNVRFRTRNDINILPVSARLYYKQPQADLDEATLQQYRDLYETFLEGPTDSLVFYETLPLEKPEIGKPLPEIDLADNVAGTIDGSLWMALIAREGGDATRAVDDARKAIAGQTLTIGIYPTNRQEIRVLTQQNNENQTSEPGLIFEIAAPDPNDTSPLPPPRYTRLSVEYAEDVLQNPGIVQVTLPEYERLRLWNFDPTEEGTLDYPPRLEDRDVAGRVVTWIRMRLPEVDQGQAGDPITRGAVLTWVGINAARVLQTIPVADERLGVAGGAPNQTYKVANTPVIVAPPGGAVTESRFEVRVQNDADVFEVWQRTDDLYAAGPEDKVYTLDPESGQVQFGSGLRGKRPGFGREIRAAYEYGGGPEGSVNIGAINKSAALPGGFKLENPVPTWGAGRGETVSEGEQNISSFVRHRDRLVTVQDFQDLTRRTPGVSIGRVEVLPLFNPEAFTPGGAQQRWPGTLTIMVVPEHNIEQSTPPAPDRLFLDTICRWLDPRRLVTTEIFVRGAQFVPVVVSIGITTMSGHVRAIVQREVQTAIRHYLSPLLGGPPTVGADGCIEPYGRGWPLGMELRSRDLEAVVVRVPGVRYANDVRLGFVTGANVQEAENRRMEGIELPWLVGISVREGDSEDPGALVGQTVQADQGERVHVPVVPRNCY